MENVTGIFVTFLTATLPLSLLVERAIAGARLLPFVPTAEGSGVWIFFAFAVGVGVCVGWQYNFVGPLARGVPALANASTFDGVAGQVLTGLFVGALTGPIHEKIGQWSASKKADLAKVSTA